VQHDNVKVVIAIDIAGAQLNSCRAAVKREEARERCAQMDPNFLQITRAVVCDRAGKREVHRPVAIEIGSYPTGNGSRRGALRSRRKRSAEEMQEEDTTDPPDTSSCAGAGHVVRLSHGRETVAAYDGFIATVFDSWIS